MKTRREFVTGCALATGVAIVLPSTQAKLADDPAVAMHSVKELPPLPYAPDALEPIIDAQTMTLHHDKHHRAYVDNLNKALAAYPQLTSISVEQLMMQLDTVPDPVRTAVRNQGGGHANHSLWWPTLKKNNGGAPSGELSKAIDTRFTSFSSFQDQLTKSAIGIFGSGWAWLLLTKDGTLSIETTPNQDSPLAAGKSPVFGIDVWEHAYYLKYQNRRPEYVKAFWGAVNWEYVNERYASLKKMQA